jgi:hypothetical protein
LLGVPVVDGCLLLVAIVCVYDLPDKAYVEIQQSKKMPVHMTIFFPDMNALEWFQAHYQQELVRSFMNGALSVTGHTRLVVNAK